MHYYYADAKIRSEDEAIVEAVADFCSKLEPVEKSLSIFIDKRNGALFAECHVLANKLIGRTTPDTPLDPEESAEYRANRDLVEDHAAFMQMVSDAKDGRSFSNIVCEYITGDDHPLKIIGGQHRFEAIRGALPGGTNQVHGIKVYFALDAEQRLDVQVISNTNIEVSRDLLDRMYETVAGADLRKWCQAVGLLGPKEDFADKRKRGGVLTVRSARSFIINYFMGKELAETPFDGTDTTPMVPRSGARTVPEWERIKKQYPELWTAPDLTTAAKKFRELVEAQRKAFDKKAGASVGSPDFADKAMNDAILSAWPFVAGLLHNNEPRLQRHFNLQTTGKPDPLRAALLAKARHVTDAENYRGLGYRTDPKERGRFVELFWLQAEKGGGLTSPMITAAIAAYHAKSALLDAKAKKEAI